MVIVQDYFFWKIIEELVVQKQYRLIYISSDHQEIWLEPDRKKQYQIIRFKRFDIDWANWILRDMDESLAKIELLRKQSLKRSLNVLNVYFSTYEPVDDWKDRIHSSQKKGHTDIKTLLIDKEHIQDGIIFLEQELNETFHTKKMFEYVEETNLEYGHIHHIKHFVLTYSNRIAKQEREIFEQGKPFFTNILLAIQIVMFILLEFFGGSTNTETLIQFGAKVNELIYEGEWWRFITPIFLHIGFFHLFMNSLALYYIGIAVEKMYGSWRFLVIYLFAGIIGSLTSFVFSPSISAGASGSIFGLFGALLLLGVFKPKLFFRTIGPNILIVIAINLAIGFTLPNVDNAGHIGGLIGGFAAALLVQLPKMAKPSLRLVGLLFSLVLSLALTYYGFVIAPKTNPEIAISTSRYYLTNGEYEKANEILRKINETEMENTEILFLLAISEFELGEDELAIQYLKQVVDTDPSYHQAYYILSVIYKAKGNFIDAYHAIEQALKLEPENKNYKNLYQQLKER